MAAVLALLGPRRRYLILTVILFAVLITSQLLHPNHPRWDALREASSNIIRPAWPPTKPDDKSLELPRDYFVESDDQKLCEQFYGLSYIRNLANKQHRYCEDGSLSAMQCFTADPGPRTSLRPWISDPMCVAQGAWLQQGSAGPLVTMQCRLRNFTHEAEHSSAAAAVYKLEGVQNVEDMGVYFFETGAGKEFQSWEFKNGANESCSAKTNNGRWILLAKREGNVNLFHKLMEIWQAMITVEAIRIARNPRTGKPYSSEPGAASIQVVFEDDRDEPLDNWWTIATGVKPIRMAGLPNDCYGNVIVPLAGSSSPFWTFLLEEREHEVCRVQTLIDTFSQRILAHLGIEPRREIDIPLHPVVTINDRAHTRKFHNLTAFVENLKRRHPNVHFNVVDFAAMSLAEQVRLVQGSDVLVGHHGAGMTHVLFLPPGAAVVEIFPPVFPSLGFRHLARMRGLTHFVEHCLPRDEWDLKANGVPLPDGWRAPESEAGWQEAEWTYLLEDDFVGLVDAAIRSQLNRRPNKAASDQSRSSRSLR